MTPPPVCRRASRGAVVAAVVGCACVAAARGGEEPGPVPLLRGDEPAASEPDTPGQAAPAGLGDWRLVAALGATFAILVGARVAASRRTAPPPPDVFEVLGTASLGGQHAVRIVRFGPKTLLVGVSSAGATTLAEIGDPQSTARIAAACRGGQPPRDRGRPPVPAARPAVVEAA